eukprot:SAG22_NODE_3625_length_1608_cov_1.595096_2_plen_74_part_00
MEVGGRTNNPTLLLSTFTLVGGAFKLGGSETLCLGGALKQGLNGDVQLLLNQPQLKIVACSTPEAKGWSTVPS